MLSVAGGGPAKCGMDEERAKRKIRVGLQVKAVVVLTLVVMVATAAGGWLYYTVTARMLHEHDLRQAERLTGGLTVAAAGHLVSGDVGALKKLTEGMLADPNLHQVCIMDRHGKAVTSAGGTDSSLPVIRLTAEPPTLSYEQRRGKGFLEVGRPIIVPGQTGRGAELVGGLRLLMDTRETVTILAGVQEEIGLSTAVVLVCAIPLGMLLVHRVVGMPIRRLVRATGRLAEGDFSARVEAQRNDEIGELASSFNTMTGRLFVSQQQLRLANETLERKVEERTAELEQANCRLRQEMAEKEDFLRAVSHDLSAPLRNIAGMTTMICVKHQGVLPEEVRTRLERIRANVDAGAELINELLELSQIRTRPERRQRVDFDKLLAEVEHAFEYEVKQKNIELKVHSSMPTLYVEKNRMRQVFQNFVDNAIKYMHRKTGGKIDIRYASVDGMHRFSVADNGPGIAREDQERVFYIFGRIASAAEASPAGRGIGLASVRSIAHNYDGWAWVESELGKGSVFHITLAPKRSTKSVPAQGEQQAEEKAEPAAASAGNVEAPGDA